MTGFGPCGGVRHALAVYVLGAIEPAERAVVDAHLASCPQCRQELAGLAGLPALLRRVTQAEAAGLSAGDDAGDRGLGSALALSALLGQAVRARRHRLRVQLAAAAAAGVIAGAGSVLGWNAAQGTADLFMPGPAAGAGSMAKAGAVNPHTLAHATVRYAPAPWGLRLQVRVSGIAAGTDCELEVISSSGQRLMAGGWLITGRPGMWYPAATWVPISQVRRFIVLSGKSVLVAIPVTDRSPGHVRSASERTSRTTRGHRYALPGTGTERVR